jgi:hypothetical protein
MFIEIRRDRAPMFPPEELDVLIKTAGVDKTILASDLGQAGNDRPVDGFKSVIGTCIDLGYTDADIRKMISTNAADLIGLDAAAAVANPTRYIQSEPAHAH